MYNGHLIKVTKSINQSTMVANIFGNNVFDVFDANKKMTHSPRGRCGSVGEKKTARDAAHTYTVVLLVKKSRHKDHRQSDLSPGGGPLGPLRRQVLEKPL
jgi:hypothetical protein